MHILTIVKAGCGLLVLVACWIVTANGLLVVLAMTRGAVCVNAVYYPCV